MKRLATSKLLFAAFLLLSIALACKFGFGSSPTATFKAFYEAQKNKDAAGLKKTLSKSSVTMMEKAAKEENKTFDEALKEGFNDPAFKSQQIPETRNEKIDGDSATLEVQDEKSKKWEKMYFVK